ncbi:MAG: hypothetical protein MUF87_07095 [Anaerolineae bacterium]|jgi:hypothetical protein|nr:hypothetical protein [Anaerolineae bacterium]
MPFDFEALVGHLYIVSGRAINMAPPGLLVEVAPTKSARGRETDTFFALILPSGEAVAPTAFYEQLAQLSAERYFNSTGSVTAGLRDMLNHINGNLFDHNQKEKQRPYEASVICAVLRGPDLIIGRVGSNAAILRHDGKLQTLPDDLSHPERLSGVPLGAKPTPEVKLTRHRVDNGTRLVLVDTNVAQFTLEQITEALSHEDIALVLVAFKELARLQLNLAVIEFVPPEAPAPIPVPQGESSAAIAEAVRAAVAKERTKNTAKRPNPLRRLFGTTGDRLIAEIQRGLSFVARQGARSMKFINQTIEYYFGKPEGGGRRWYTLPIATGVVILIPIIIVSLVVTLWVSSTGDSAYEQCMQELNRVAETARGIPSSNPGGRLSTWDAVMEAARRCETLRPGDATITALILEGQGVIDQINIVTRVTPIQLDPIPGASLKRIVLRGLDLYLLDGTNSQVYQAILAANGQSYSRLPNPIVSMRRGATLDGFQISEIIDITFSQVNDSIYALDRNGVLIECPSRLTQNCRAQALLGEELWGNPIAITTWGSDDRLYILDPAENQIWRYDRTAGTYASAGREYFTGQNLSSIGNAVDFAINEQGVVHVLLNDGTVLRYLSGARQEFVYGGLPPGQEISAAQAMFLDENPIGLALYIINRETRTIYEVSLSGTFRASYRIFDEDRFSTLSGVAVDPGQGRGILYAIAGNSVFVLQKP